MKAVKKNEEQHQKIRRRKTASFEEGGQLDQKKEGLSHRTTRSFGRVV